MKYLLPILLIFSLYAQETSPLYLGLRPQVIDPNGAELRGITGTATASLTVVGIFNSDRRLHIFNVAILGSYKLFTDTGAGFTEDTTFAGNLPFGMIVLGGDAKDGIGSGTALASDTLILQTLTDPIVFLTGLSATNQLGGGWLSKITGNQLEGIWAFSSGTPGDQYVRVAIQDFTTVNILWAGAIPDDITKGANNTKAIQNCIDQATSPLKYEVLIPNGVFTVNASNPGSSFCLDIQQGTILRGTVFRPETGSTLELADNQNCTIISDSTIEAANEWWHWGRIERINFRCNGDNNNPAQGIDIFKMGEVSAIENCNFRNYRGKAISIRGAKAPALISNVTVNPAASADTLLDNKERIGVFIDAPGVINIRELSGDSNNPMIFFGGGNAYISGLKIENAAPFINDPNSAVVWMDSTDGTTDQIGFVNSKINFGGLNIKSIFRITGDPNIFASFSVIASQFTGYDNFYDLVATSQVLPESVIGQSVSSFFKGGNGVNASIVDGFVTFPYLSGSSGLKFENQNAEFTNSIFFSTDLKWHLKSPRFVTLFEDFTGADLMEMRQQDVTVFTRLLADSLLQANNGFKLLDTGSLIDSAFVSGVNPDDILNFYSGGVSYKAPRILPSSELDTIKIKRSANDFELENTSGFADPAFAIFSTSFERTVLDFSDAATQAAQISFTPEQTILNADSIWIDFYWFSAVTTGDVTWASQVMFSQNNGLAGSGVSASIIVNTTTNSTADTYIKTRIALSPSMDLGKDDDVRFRITRFGADAGDTMLSDARLQWLIINYLR